MSTRGSSIVTDGLVMCVDKYDKNSYLGEPTTNVVHYTNLNNGWSQGYNTDIVFDEIDPPVGIDSPTVGFKDANTDWSGYWYSYGDYAPQDPSTTYTISMYVKIAQDANCAIQWYTADNSETGRQSGEFLYFNYRGQTTSSSNTTVVTEPDSRGWIRLVWASFTTPSNTQSDSLSFYWSGFTGRMWLCAPQMEAKSHATKYVGNSANNGTVTTRSSTAGWQDLSGNGNHCTLSDLTYSSTYIPGTSNNNDFSFDGVDNYVTQSNFQIGNGRTRTLSCWAYINAIASENLISMTANANNYKWQYFQIQSGRVYYMFGDNSFYNERGYSAVLATANAWYNFVITVDTALGSGNSVKIYANKVSYAVTYQNNSLNTIYDDSDMNLHIGGGNWAGSFDGNAMDGEIGNVQIYDRALNEVEISQNFDVQKSRYGL